ncbi:MAG: hypothetical protein LQ342_004700 [Letrouitia transgressa]|nr:MAG: hypothetical protein LQ342_004700 [Letrouitia transgressa]
MLGLSAPSFVDQHQRERSNGGQALPVRERRDRRNNAATGASAAGIRTLGSQMIAFYFRAPAKAFFRTRVDYLGSPTLASMHIIEAFRLIKDSVGAILYTSYLQAIGFLHPPSSKSSKRTYPRSFVAAPLDALSVRFRPSDVLSGHYSNMWQYGLLKLREIGVRGVFAGWSLSFLKDSFGYALFFSTFEFLKAQGYYTFITWYYQEVIGLKAREKRDVHVITPHFAIEPIFLMLAGVAATVSQQVIQHPIGRVQEVYYKSLPSLDKQNHASDSKSNILRNYYKTYHGTYKQCLARAVRSGGWRPWLLKGFFYNTIKQVPSTSAGLIILELVRRRYSSESGDSSIEADGYNILLV